MRAMESCACYQHVERQSAVLSSSFSCAFYRFEISPREKVLLYVAHRRRASARFWSMTRRQICVALLIKRYPSPGFVTHRGATGNPVKRERFVEHYGQADLKLSYIYPHALLTFSMSSDRVFGRDFLRIQIAPEILAVSVRAIGRRSRLYSIRRETDVQADI